MTSFQEFDAFAASRGEGLHPKLRALLERTATLPLWDVTILRDSLMQAGPSPDSEVVSSGTNVIVFSRQPVSASRASRDIRHVVRCEFQRA